MEKDFDRWNSQKKQTDEIKNEPVMFYEREVWWCAAGINIGVEIDGKHELFSRPTVVIRKFNKDMLLVAPTTTQDKSNKYYLQKQRHRVLRRGASEAEAHNLHQTIPTPNRSQALIGDKIKIGYN